jgi:hypothetical protein
VHKLPRPFRPSIAGKLKFVASRNLNGGLRFRFELDTVTDIQAWGEPDQRSLHWFGLTSGRYWIDTPVGEVLRYTAEVRKLWNYPFLYVDYPIARLFEDLQEHLPAISEPVPNEIAHTVSNPKWLKRVARWREGDGDKSEIEERWDLYDAAVGWWHEREIDTAYLSHGPWLSIWCTGEGIHFRWSTQSNDYRGVAVFQVPKGYFEISLSDFRVAAYGFCEEVLLVMKERTQLIRHDGWKRTDCAVDVAALVAEQQRREDSFANVRRRLSVTDWNRVRTALDTIIDRVKTAS